MIEFTRRELVILEAVTDYVDCNTLGQAASRHIITGEPKLESHEVSDLWHKLFTFLTRGKPTNEEVIEATRVLDAKTVGTPVFDHEGRCIGRLMPQVEVPDDATRTARRAFEERTSS